MRFHATLEAHGKTATGIAVPPEVVEALGGGRRPPVRVTIAGHTYRSTVAGARRALPGRRQRGESRCRRRRHTLAVEEAKTDATRARRVARGVEALREGRG